MELLYKAENYISKKLGFRRIHGKFYPVSTFEEQSREIFSDEVSSEYDRLIKLYPTKADIRKGEENRILFIEMIHRLRLENSYEQLRILDLGSRGGVFPYICSRFGHSAVATDLKEVLEKSPNPEMLNLFKVEHTPLRIEPFVPLGETFGRFDLVTGFRTRFHSRYTWETGKEHEEHWGIDEWDFLLRDLACNHLHEDGRIFFMVNRLQEREKGLIIPEHLRKYFLSVGAQIQYSFLLFEDLSGLRN